MKNNFGKFSYTKEEHGISQEDLDVFGAAVEYFNNLIRTSPEWKEIFIFLDGKGKRIEYPNADIDIRLEK